MTKALISHKVSWWARTLAWLFLAALTLAIVGVARDSIAAGKLELSVAGLVMPLLFGYLTLTIGYVAMTGCVPGKFFPPGALRWPFRVWPRT